jgi:hypothetical protein
MRKIVLLLVAIGICGASAPLALSQTYRPSTYSDGTMFPTVHPTYAYDGNLTTYAQMGGVYSAGEELSGICTWSGFPSYTPSGSLTLNISLAVPSISHGTVTIYVEVSGQRKAGFSYSSTLNQTTDQWTVPAGTNLDTISVYAEVFGIGPEGDASARIYEIWIQ